MRRNTLLPSDPEPSSQPTKAVLPVIILGTATVLETASPALHGDTLAAALKRKSASATTRPYEVFDLGCSSRVDDTRDHWAVLTENSGDLIDWDNDLNLRIPRPTVSVRINIVAREPRVARLDLDKTE